MFSGNQAINAGSVGGAIFNGGTVNLKGAIFAASAPSNCGGVAVTASSSIADDGSCFNNGMNGNSVVATSAIGLASGLANNGGPTATIALQGGGMEAKT